MTAEPYFQLGGGVNGWEPRYCVSMSGRHWTDSGSKLCYTFVALVSHIEAIIVRRLHFCIEIAVTLFRTYCGCEVDAPFVLLFEADVGRLLVESDAKAFQLVFYQLLVAKRFQHIEHYQDEVASSSH